MNTKADLKVVTERAPTEEELRDLIFCWQVAKFVKSNAIVYSKNQQTIGIGAGQMSRVYSAKIAGIKMCESYNRQYGTDFRAVMPTNLYGPNDNFHSSNSHVIPALLRRFHEAKIAGQRVVTIWGTGKPLREFLHVDDMADACVYVMELCRGAVYPDTGSYPLHINVGSGKEISIRELAETICEITGFSGDIQFDATKPDGTPRKLLDVSRLASLGWQSRIPLRDGLKKTYSWYTENESRLRGTEAT